MAGPLALFHKKDLFSDKIYEFKANTWEEIFLKI